MEIRNIYTWPAVILLAAAVSAFTVVVIPPAVETAMETDPQYVWTVPGPGLLLKTDPLESGRQVILLIERLGSEEVQSALIPCAADQPGRFEVVTLILGEEDLTRLDCAGVTSLDSLELWEDVWYRWFGDAPDNPNLLEEEVPSFQLAPFYLEIPSPPPTRIPLV